MAHGPEPPKEAERRAWRLPVGSCLQTGQKTGQQTGQQTGRQTDQQTGQQPAKCLILPQFSDHPALISTSGRLPTTTDVGRSARRRRFPFGLREGALADHILSAERGSAAGKKGSAVWTGAQPSGSGARTRLPSSSRPTPRPSSRRRAKYASSASPGRAIASVNRSSQASISSSVRLVIFDAPTGAALMWRGGKNTKTFVMRPPRRHPPGNEDRRSHRVFRAETASTSGERK
jgi:hypothetical protein